MPRAKVLIVGTVRPEEVEEDDPLQRLWPILMHEGQLTTLSLTPLNVQETAVLAKQITGRALDAEPAARLFQETAGNPLFIIESVRAGDEQHDGQDDLYLGLALPRDENRAERSRLPPKVYAVIRARLLRLSPQARDLVHLAATIGRIFSVELLVHASEQDEGNVLTGLDELWRRRIVREVSAEHYDFSHDRIRDCAYAEISPLQRRLLHRRAAHALESVHAHDLAPVAGELGVHYERGGLLKEASDWYWQAAESAKQLFAHRERAGYLTKAIALVQSFPDRRKWAEDEIVLLLDLGLAQILTTSFGSEPVGMAWQQAYELAMEAGTTFLQCRALLGLDIYHRNRGEWRTARALAEKNISLIQSETDVFLRQCVLSSMGAAVYHFGEPAHALGYFDEMLTLAREGSKPSFAWINNDSTTNGLVRSAKCLWFLGFSDQARARCDQAVSVVYQSSGLFSVCAALDFSAMVYSFCRDVQTVHRLGVELLEFATEHDFPFYVRAGNMFVGWAQAQQGEAGPGAAKIRVSVDQHRSNGTRMFEPYWRSLLAEALALAGNVSEALDEVEDALAFAEETANCYWNAHLLKLKADLLLALPASAAEAEQWYERALATARRQRARSLELRATLGLSRLWHHQGKNGKAHQLLAPIYASFKEGFDTADLREAKMLLDELRGDDAGAHASSYVVSSEN